MENLQQKQYYQLDLLQAIEDEETEKVLEMLEDEKYTQLDTFDPPLIIAAIKNNNKDIFLKLLISPLYYKNGKITDMNTILDQDGCSALGHCAINNFSFGLKILLNDFTSLVQSKQLDSRFIKYLKSDIDINYQLEDGSTLFHVGIFSNSAQILQIIINNGGDYNIGHEEGSPLHLAMKERCFRAAKFLAKIKDLDFLIVDTYGSGVFHDCIFLDLQDIFTLVVQNLNDRYQESENGKEYVLQVINLKNNIGNTPLLEAAQQNNPFYLEFLLENAAKYNIDLELKNNLNETYKDMKKVYKRRRDMNDSDNDSEKDDYDENEILEESKSEKKVEKKNKKEEKKQNENQQVKNRKKQTENQKNNQQKDAGQDGEYEQKYFELEKQKKQMQKDDKQLIIIIIILLILGYGVVYFFTKDQIPKQKLIDL